MAIKIKIKLNQDYGSPEVHKEGSTVEFPFDEAMAIVQAGFGDQVEDKSAKTTKPGEKVAE